MRWEQAAQQELPLMGQERPSAVRLQVMILVSPTYVNIL